MPHMHRTLWTLLLLLPLLAFDAGAAADSDEGQRPFEPGEGLRYEIRLLGVVAAEADLRIAGRKDENLRIQATARTVGATDSIFKMRSQASCTLEEDLEPSLCRSTSESRGNVKRREVRFDKGEGKVVERKMEKGKVDQKTIALDPGLDRMQDALSGLYMIRANLPEVGGAPLEFRSILKGKPVMVEARALRSEMVETRMGSFAATVVDVKILGDQDPDAATHATLWVTTDESRLPLRATTKAPIGTMEASLVGATGTKSGKLARR